MSFDDIPILDVTLSPIKRDEQIRKIVTILKPKWNTNQITAKPLSGGYVNVTSAYFSNPAMTGDGIVVKSTDEFFLGPNDELRQIYRFLQMSGLFTIRILAFLQNGFCMEYADGTPLCRTGPEVLQPEYWRPIMDEVAHWHSKQCLELARRFGLRYLEAHIFPVHKYYEQIMNRPPMKQHKHEFPTLEQVLYEEQLLVEEMQTRGAFQPSVTHGDMNPSNILFHNGKAHLTDTDYACIYVEEMDLIGFFYSILDPSIPNWSLAPDEEHQKEILEYYIEAKAKLDEEEPRDVLDVFHNVQCALPLFYIRIICCGVFFAESNPGGIGEAWIEFGKKLWREYHQVKKDTMRRRDEYFNSKIK